MNITLVNLNLVSVPAIAPYALDVLASSLKAAGHDPSILDLCREPDPIGALRAYFTANRPDLVGLSMRNAGDLYFPSLFDLPNKGSFLESHRQLVDVVKTYVDPERIVIGGVGFSVNPTAYLKRLGLRYGVRGPGEVVLCELANQLRESPLKDLGGGAEAYVFDGRKTNVLTSASRIYVDNEWYYRYGGQAGIRTTSGCVMHCSYCAEPSAVGGLYRKAAVKNALAELDELVSMGIRDFQSADSEFNMPLGHSKQVLRAIIARHYGRDVRFWAYCQPKPFDEEYAMLMAKAGVVGINFGTDHTNPDVLNGLAKWYGLEDIAKTTRLCQENGIAVMHELIFGSPGDTPDKMHKAIDDVLQLQPWVVGVSIGLGVFPDTPLGALFERHRASGVLDQGFYFKGEPMVDPTFYMDPAFKVPEVFDQFDSYARVANPNIMLPTRSSVGSTNNQLVNSERVRHQLLVEKRKGPSWYHFPGRDQR